MEPVTHLLTGACLSRAFGFPRRVRHATLACVVAAELPDADWLYHLVGPITYFQHHRGWTHAFWSLPLQAALVVGLVYGWDHLRRSWRKRRSRAEESPMRPVLLGVVALLGLLSHILLDWTNNYGVRPFAPWNPRWYSAELVFIIEPAILLVLALALLVPLILSLSDSEMGIRRTRLRGQGLAIAALLLVVAFWVWRSQERAAAIEIARNQQYPGGESLRISADPYPVNPYRWHMVVETPLNFVAGTVDTRLGIMEPEQLPYPKPATTLATLAAKHSRLGRVYLDFTHFALVEEIGTAAEIHPGLDLSPPEQQLTVVRFRDLRFLYDVWGFTGRSSNALAGEAWVDSNRQVVRSSFSGKVQR